MAKKVSMVEVIKELNSKLDQLISAVLDNKKTPTLGFDLTLWNTGDIAIYAKVTTKYASENIVTHHSFPIAVRLPTKNSSRGHPRWYAKEVMDWVKKHQRE